MENLQILQWIGGMSAFIGLIVGIVQLYRWCFRNRDKKTPVVPSRPQGGAFRIGPGKGNAIVKGDVDGDAVVINSDGNAIRID